MKRGLTLLELMIVLLMFTPLLLLGGRMLRSVTQEAGLLKMQTSSRQSLEYQYLLNCLQKNLNEAWNYELIPVNTLSNQVLFYNDQSQLLGQWNTGWSDHVLHITHRINNDSVIYVFTNQTQNLEWLPHTIQDPITQEGQLVIQIPPPFYITAHASAFAHVITPLPGKTLEETLQQLRQDQSYILQPHLKRYVWNPSKKAFR